MCCLNYCSVLCWPDWVRSSDLQINSLSLLPTELLASITHYLKLWSGILGSHQASKLDTHSVITTTPHLNFGAPSRIRTDHPGITSAVLYQMSYRSIFTTKLLITRLLRQKLFLRVPRNQDDWSRS